MCFLNSETGCVFPAGLSRFGGQNNAYSPIGMTAFKSGCCAGPRRKQTRTPASVFGSEKPPSPFARNRIRSWLGIWDASASAEGGCHLRLFAGLGICLNLRCFLQDNVLSHGSFCLSHDWRWSFTARIRVRYVALCSSVRNANSAERVSFENAANVLEKNRVRVLERREKGQWKLKRRWGWEWTA